MQKNKIDIVKVVCSSAVKRIALLTLTVAVGGSAVASADPPRAELIERLIAELGDEGNKQRLEALNAIVAEKERVYRAYVMRLNDYEDKIKWAELRLAQDKNHLIRIEEKINGTKACAESDLRLLRWERKLAEESKSRLSKSLENWRKETAELRRCIDGLNKELYVSGGLVEQRDILRAELEAAIPEEYLVQAEFMEFAENFAREQGGLVEEVAPQYLAKLGLPKETIQNMMRLFGYENPQQPQPAKSFCGRFNPFNRGFFGGKK